jgi:hypothetical protein
MKITATEEWSKAAIEHMKKLDMDGKYDFVHTLIFDLALYGGYNLYETIGILDVIKADLLESYKATIDDCDGDCDNCPHKDEDE